MKESNKLGKISFNVLATLLGTTAVAALVGIGTTLAFGLQGQNSRKVLQKRQELPS